VRKGALDSGHSLAPGRRSHAWPNPNAVVGGLHAIERNGDDSGSRIDGAVQALTVQQGPVRNESDAQAQASKLATQIVPMWMKQWLAPRDVDVVAAKVHEILRHTAELLDRELPDGWFAALIFAVEAAQVASARDLQDAGMWLTRYAIERVRAQTKRTPA